MLKLKISLSSDLLQQLDNKLNMLVSDVLPLTARTMESGAERIAKDWRSFAEGGPLKGVEPLTRPNRSYILGVKVNPNGPFDYEIVNESRAAAQIEEGTPELDMKTTHPYGPKSRISKKGVPYLIIPFRWGTPGTKSNPRVGFRNVMPQQVYNIIKNFYKMNKLVGADESNIKTPNAQTPSKMVGRAQYNKGYDRLSGMDFSGTIREKTRMSGMVRTTDETGKDRTGGYLTFRIISAKSPQGSWIKPRVEARHVVSALVENHRRSIGAEVEAAIKEDLGI